MSAEASIRTEESRPNGLWYRALARGTLVVAVFCAVVFLFIWALLRTQIGLRLRATGDSESALGFRGLRAEPGYIVGLAIANGIAAWAGSVIRPTAAVCMPVSRRIRSANGTWKP